METYIKYLENELTLTLEELIKTMTRLDEANAKLDASRAFIKTCFGGRN